MTDPSDVPVCSRQPNPDRDVVWVTFGLSVNQNAGLDALVRLDDTTRKALISVAVDEYISRRLLELTMALRMAGRNVSVADSSSDR